jgi:hypothetical protein
MTYPTIFGDYPKISFWLHREIRDKEIGDSALISQSLISQKTEALAKQLYGLLFIKSNA